MNSRLHTNAPAATAGEPQEALEALRESLCPVGHEEVDLDQACGRITAQALVSDRPSPPCHTSAMDGYALRLEDLKPGRIDVSGEILPGRPAPSLPHGKAIRIMTGAMLPEGAECVIQREQVVEAADHILLGADLQARPGQNIRRCGENLAAGQSLLEAGAIITPAVCAALATFGICKLKVHRRLRLACLTTGDELLDPASPAHPWQIRNSNGPALRGLLSACPWVEERVQSDRVADEPDVLRQAVDKALAECDGLLITGGVSAGTHDFVPEILRQAGCRILFHKLPLRPGRPVLGGVGPQGQVVMGLPGNPLSVMVTGRRLALPALAHRAGLNRAAIAAPPAVTLQAHDGKTLALWWYRPVRLIAPGQALLVQGRGSGDIICGARSDGFIEIPPGQAATGPWPYYSWSP